MLRIRPVLMTMIGLMLVAGCSDPRDTVLPNDMSKWDELKPVIDQLSAEEKELIGSYIMRVKAGEVFGGSGIPPGTTLRMAIEAQRQHLADIALKQKEKEDIVIEMQSVLTVEFLGKSKRLRNSIDYLLVEFRFRNAGTRTISGIKGDAVFVDMFDDEIARIELKLDEPIIPSSVRDWSGAVSTTANFQVKSLMDADRDKIRFRFEPEMILFIDGSRLSTASKE